MTSVAIPLKTLFMNEPPERMTLSRPERSCSVASSLVTVSSNTRCIAAASDS